MEVHLTPDQEAFVQQAIASGRLQREEEAVQEAFALWEERERNRVEISAALDSSERDLESGRFTDHADASLSQLADDIKREARSSRGNGSSG
jgi:Arc/MetJ-type ribon-helix-helix transcriptional regulator